MIIAPEMNQFQLISRNMEEIVTEKEILGMDFNSSKGYIGIEPSGIPHIAMALMWTRKINDIVDTGVKMSVLLADWHAKINDKFAGDMDKIRASGEIFMRTMKAFGLRQNVDFVWASDVVSSSDYWSTLLRVAKEASLPRIRRALPIMGRTDEEADRDFSKYIYPLMQVTDIIYMGIDLALGGMDQRHAHMLCRDIQDKMHIEKTKAVHGPLLGSLKGQGRMDSGNGQFSKMSKSDPDSAIFVFDEKDDLDRKIRNSYCPVRDVQGNPLLDIVRYIIFPHSERGITIEREERHGGNIHFEDYASLKDSYARGDVHPLDLKQFVSDELYRMLEPARDLKSSVADLLEKISQ